jgi:hypothetical protein
LPYPNFTEAALDRNIELGVLIRDRALALTVAGYFRNLIDRDLPKPLPAVPGNEPESATDTAWAMAATRETVISHLYSLPHGSSSEVDQEPGSYR